MIKINYLNFLVISQHYRVTIKEFIIIIFVSHTSPKTRNFWHKLRSAKARPHSVKTSLLHLGLQDKTYQDRLKELGLTTLLNAKKGER